jgi:hypothetical protein
LLQQLVLLFLFLFNLTTNCKLTFSSKLTIVLDLQANKSTSRRSWTTIFSKEASCDHSVVVIVEVAVVVIVEAAGVVVVVFCST